MVWAESVTFKRPVRDGCRSPQGVAGGRRWAACPEPCVCQTGPEEGESSADPMVHEGARTLTHTQHKEGCWLCEPRGWPASGLLDPGPRNAAKGPGPQGLHSADLSIPVRADCPRGHRMAARSTALRASPFTICRLRREPLPGTSRKEGRSSPYTSCPSRTQNLWDMWAVVLRQQVCVVLAGLREGMSGWVPGQQPAVSTTDTAAGWGAATVDFRQWRGACPAGLTAVSLTHCPSSSVPFHPPTASSGLSPAPPAPWSTGASAVTEGRDVLRPRGCVAASTCSHLPRGRGQQAFHTQCFLKIRN